MHITSPVIILVVLMLFAKFNPRGFEKSAERIGKNAVKTLSRAGHRTCHTVAAYRRAVGKR